MLVLANARPGRRSSRTRCPGARPSWCSFHPQIRRPCQCNRSSRWRGARMGASPAPSRPIPPRGRRTSIRVGRCSGADRWFCSRFWLLWCDFNNGCPSRVPLNGVTRIICPPLLKKRLPRRDAFLPPLRSSSHGHAVSFQLQHFARPRSPRCRYACTEPRRAARGHVQARRDSAVLS